MADQALDAGVQGHCGFPQGPRASDRGGVPCLYPLLPEQSLFGAELLAIDGTKIAAVASRKRVITPVKIEKMNAAIDRKIAEYLASMDEADREEPKATIAQADVAAAIEALKAQKERLQSQAEELAARGLKQLVETEREAKLMRTPHGHAVAYNAQIAVDAKHKLIVAFELTNEGNDYRQLYPMAAQGKDAVGADQVTAVADTGYSNGEYRSGALYRNRFAEQIELIRSEPLASLWRESPD